MPGSLLPKMPTVAASRAAAGLGGGAAGAVTLVAENVAAGALYFLAARLSLWLGATSGAVVTPLWLPSAFALAGILLFGRRIVPALVVADIAGSLTIGIPFPVTIPLALATIVEPLFAAWVVRRAGTDIASWGVTAVLRLLVASLAAPILSATLGITVLLLAGLEARGEAPSDWQVWWLADGLAILVLTPALLAAARPRATAQAFASGEGAAFALALGFAAWLVVLHPGAFVLRITPTLATLPLLVWAALRFRQVGAAVIAPALAAVALWATIRGSGPFFEGPMVTELLAAQLFAAIQAGSAFLLAAAVSEGRDAMHALRLHRTALEATVEERTRTLARRERQLAQAQAVARVGSWEWELPSDRIEWSEETYRIFGLDPGITVTPAVIEERIHPADRERVAASRADVIRLGGTLSLEFRILPRPGMTRWVCSHTRALRGPDGVPESMVGTVQDITESKRSEMLLRESEERYRFIAENVSDQISVHDADGTILYVSPSVRQVGGFEPEELIGRSPYELFHPDDVENVLAIHQRAREEPFSTYTLTVRSRRKDGSYGWYEARGKPIADPATGEVVKFIVTARDITKRKAAEERIAALNAALRRRVDELAAANQQLEAFSDTASHDLRAPLRRIGNLAHLIEESERGRIGPEGLEGLQRLMGEAHRLGRLIDDLLQLSRVGRAALSPAPVDLAELARGIVSELKRAEPSRDVVLEVEGDLRVEADPSLIRIALENLVENAWKYTRDRDTARIFIGAEDEDGVRVVRIQDNGIGFESVEAQRLFQPFHRLAGAERFEGTGVGLASVRRIIEKHGGRIWAEGRKGVGSTFFFTLPAAT